MKIIAVILLLMVFWDLLQATILFWLNRDLIRKTLVYTLTETKSEIKEVDLKDGIYGLLFEMFGELLLIYFIFSIWDKI